MESGEEKGSGRAQNSNFLGGSIGSAAGQNAVGDSRSHVEGESSNGKEPDVPLDSGDPSGGPRSCEEQIAGDHNIARMENTLIGKFYGMRLNIEVVCGFVKRKWNLKGQVDVVAMNKGCLSFSFSCEEDRKNILSNVGREKKFVVQVLVWIKLLGLPMEYWDEDVFARIANAFGELITIDPVTTSRRRLIYARICIGVGPETDMPEEIEIEKLGKWKQNIVYETIPFQCFHCKKVGHWAKKCQSNVVKSQSQRKVWKKVDNSLKASHSDGLDQEKQSQVGRKEEVLVRELGNEMKKGDNENSTH
ncbi:uncharacterized protein LOC131030331 [Cryptomeria japonica]|uniref:uncharacterized protein LOC131030331 n=1 Tax=Cryptomeria japonica TaxID=3369 RepID=UPI0025ACE949|nr:uncharacterized protein LOC131030331 [Cryptomeria japonica]